jgi:hypothetical protein
MGKAWGSNSPADLQLIIEDMESLFPALTRGPHGDPYNPQALTTDVQKALSVPSVAARGSRLSRTG